MYTGEIQAVWSDIRPGEHGKTRQKMSLTEGQEELQKVGVYLVEGYVAEVDPGGLRPEWRGWRYSEVGTSARYVNTSPGNTATRGLDTVSSGGSPTEEPQYTSIDISSKRPRPECVIIPTGEKDHVVDEDDSVVSDDMSDMGEKCDLRAATMPGISFSEGVRYSRTCCRKGT